MVLLLIPYFSLSKTSFSLKFDKVALSIINLMTFENTPFSLYKLLLKILFCHLISLQICDRMFLVDFLKKQFLNKQTKSLQKSKKRFIFKRSFIVGVAEF
jgi:hypothetical protein